MRALLAMTALLLSLTACSGIEVDRDYDTAFDFSNTRSWAWKPAAPDAAAPAHPLADSTLLDERLRTAISQALAGRGLHPATNTPADVFVDYRLLIEPPLVATREPRIGVGMGASSHGGAFGGVSIRFGKDRSELAHELLIIDISHPASGKLLWRGSARRASDTSSSPEAAAARSSETVNAILKAFPPAP